MTIEEHDMEPMPQTLNPHYKPANKLHGKVGLITGGDSGVGRAICYIFSLEGGSIAFTYKKGAEEMEAAEQTLQKMKELKIGDAKDPIAIPTDVGYDENCRKVVDEVVNYFGKIDILVNNAAERHMANSIKEITAHSLERVFRTNIFSLFFITRHCLKHMREGSIIINSASTKAYTGSPVFLDYASTEGAIVAFTRGLSLDLAEKGIRVNAVAAGPLWTPLRVTGMSEDSVANLGAETAMGRAAQPYEIATSYVFLATQESSFLTGQVLHPNGGISVSG